MLLRRSELSYHVVAKRPSNKNEQVINIPWIERVHRWSDSSEQRGFKSKSCIKQYYLLYRLILFSHTATLIDTQQEGGAITANKAKNTLEFIPGNDAGYVRSRGQIGSV